MLPKPRTVYQQTETDCLLACCSSVLLTMGKRAELAKLIDYNALGADGMSIAALRHYEDEFDVSIRGFWADPTKLELLKKVNTLLIAHQKHGHFVVLRVGDSTSYVMDPAQGMYKIGNTEIASSLSGAFVQIKSHHKERILARWSMRIRPGLVRLIRGFSTHSASLFILGLVISQLAIILASQVPLTVLESTAPILPALMSFGTVLLVIVTGSWLQFKGMKGLDHDFTYTYVPALFKGALTREYEYYSMNSSAALVQKLNLRGQLRDDLLSRTLPSLLGIAGSTVVGAYLLWLSPIAFAGVATAYVCFLIVSLRMASVRSSVQTKLTSLYIKFSTQATVDIKNVANFLVRQSAQQRTQNWNSTEKDIRALGIRLYGLAISESTIIMIFSVAITTWVSTVGWYGLLANTMTTGSVLSIQALCALMMGFAPSFQGVISGLSEASAVAEQNEDLFTPEAKSSLIRGDCDDAIMEIDQLNVQCGSTELFSTPISTRIYKGDRIAIVGESGVGKSSIIKALAGLSAQSGRITLDASVNRDDISVELPGMSLGQGSLRELFSEHLTHNEQVSDAMIWETLNLVGLDDKIRRLPKQLDSHIKVEGGNLSTGQTQRLRLAIALIQQPTIALWDEGLSHLDSDTALKFLRRLADSPRYRELTLIAVTHDEKTCAAMNRVWRITSAGLSEVPPT